MQTLKTWWLFSRPHTIIGSYISITALFVIACAEAAPALNQNIGALVDNHTTLYILTLLSALACNIFIVGLNQWQDIDVDRINKPWLPLAAGTMKMRTAQAVIFSSLIFSLLCAASLSSQFLLLMLIINGIGAAYSLPPMKLKRHHLPAAFAIVSVRGLLVNLGMTAHFMQQITGKWSIPAGVWPLALFVVGFSFGIAWFKDIPDTKGDEVFQFKTLAVSMSRKTALWLGVAVVAIAYTVVAASPFVISMKVNTAFFSLSHLTLCLLFIYIAAKLSLHDEKAIKKFYMFYWGLFFAEYIIYPFAYLLA